MIRRFALWLATVTDAWARRLHDDDTATGLAFAADTLEAWEVDCGTLIPHTLAQPLTFCPRRAAMRRHPAGSRRT